MRIIKRIARLLGYSIKKYSDPSAFSNRILSLHPEIKNNAPLITQEQAVEALKSVGRNTGVNAFTYYKRPNKSSAAMEDLESKWWNANGKLIEKVWVFSKDTNNSYRKNYVSRAASFFKEPGKKAKILDLGCGSGWFGRMIADAELEYHGLDFSSTQIDIAKSEKQRSPNKNYLNYYCSSDLKNIEHLDTFTGVVIHAFLHHLYWEELEQLFKELAKLLPNGCKFFIMEPVYPGKNNAINIAANEQSCNNELVNAYRKNLDHIKNKLIDKDLYDTKTESELIELGSESDKNGFFLSPKEVPFEMTEFQTFLTKYIKIENTFNCGVLNLETAQLLERIRSKEMQDHYSQLLLPMVNSLDTFLISNHYFEANPNNYLFTAFECVLNKK